jgi:hypothetical protein
MHVFVIDKEQVYKREEEEEEERKKEKEKGRDYLLDDFNPSFKMLQ